MQLKIASILCFTYDFKDIEVKQNAPKLLEKALRSKCKKCMSINQKVKCVVQMTLTTYDEELCKILEPNVCTTKERVKALQIFRDNGIPTVVWLSPILPFINDTRENIEGILDYVGYSVLPSERGKGFASKMLELILLEAKSLGIGKLLLTCDIDNIASQKTIENCGGIAERHEPFVYEDELYYKY